MSEYIGKHAAVNDGPWGEFAVEDSNEDYVPKHGKVEDLKTATEEASREAMEELEEMPSFDEHMKEMPGEVQEQDEAEEMEKRRLIEQLEEAKEDLRRAENGFEETEEVFDKLVKDLEMMMEDRSADTDELLGGLKRARLALEDYDDARRKLEKASDGMAHFNQMAVEVLDEEEFDKSKKRVMGNFEKTDAAKRKVNRADDGLEQMKRAIYRMEER